MDHKDRHPLGNNVYCVKIRYEEEYVNRLYPREYRKLCNGSCYWWGRIVPWIFLDFWNNKVDSLDFS